MKTNSEPRSDVTTLTVLGATGSIGQNTLDIVGRHGDAFEISALTAQNNVHDLARLARTHNARLAVIGDESRLDELKHLLAGTGTIAAAGEEAIIAAAGEPVDCVMAAIVGAAGLKPTFAATRSAARIALANKECLVTAGEAFMAQIKHHGVELLPVDSEHSGVFQSLAMTADADIEAIVLTASGGPFRTWTRDQMARATVEQALDHPNWAMGAKVSIDSATMMNKGLELIEAYHLFPVQPSQLSCLVHPQSIVHCLVSFRDGTTLAQMANPDMRTPIAFALGWPRRLAAPTKRLDISELSGLTFEPADPERFPALRLARQALEIGGAAPCVLNAANEVAVQSFLDGRIGFAEIPQIVEWVLEQAQLSGWMRAPGSLNDVLEIDREARVLSASRLDSAA